MNTATEGLQVTKLTKTYPGGIRALDAVDLTVGPGLYGLLGPNGAGKSTLMRTLATLQQPDSGTITLDGVDALADPDYVRRRLGYLPQQIGTYPTVTGRQLLERFAWLKGRTDAAERRREVAELLERVNLLADADRAVATALHGDLLWLPEDAGWDIAGGGFGGWNRRATIAAAIAAAHVTRESGLRKEPGAEWLRVGVPGWVGLECVRRENGIDAWLALLTRSGSHVSEAFGALGAPAVSVAAAGDTTWVREYSSLATGGWVETLERGQAAGVVRAVVAGVRAGRTFADALAGAVGEDVAEALLGAPAASDVLVARAERTLDVAGRRWRWRDGGWAPVSESIHVTQRFEDDRGVRRRIGPVPTTVEPDAPFTLFDAGPSFERTPADNVWRRNDD